MTESTKMAKQISWIGDDFRAAFTSYLQSGNINFLIGSGASMPAISVAFDIETQIDALVRAGNIQEANAIAYGFIRDLIAGSSAGNENPNGAMTLEAYKQFIAALDQILFARKSSLLPRQATIFTTNYDPFIARACSQTAGLVLNDGFERTSETPLSQTFRPERFFDRTYRAGSVFGRKSELPTVNLVKLHGCLSWVKEDSSIFLRSDELNTLSDADSKNPVKVEEFLVRCFLILPNFRKFHDTLFERVYYDQLRIFANSFEQENALLIAIGFSFRDEHILEITKRALRNPTSQIVLPAYDAAAADDFLKAFEHQSNVLVAVPEDGEIINLSTFASLLSSVSPLDAPK
ncbi:hypothetical protein AWH62_03170 [Maricaulis sp. W15]|uniref:SIR2 family protein n=1 Tax=Maricaulis sp. W15 TaxID=1772333 RepID=UPI0009488C2B|nr:SIR2 family protein [Maricaulis sp. W15]OLF77690.1 hypothetical protein AWH62_03170 [Maricaulis sp. W15]